MNFDIDSWVVGIVEGEGYIGVMQKRNVVLSIKMTDKDTMDKLGKYFDQKVNGPYGKPQYKLFYEMKLCGPKVMDFIFKAYPYLSLHRREQCDNCIEVFYRESLRRYRERYIGDECLHGHIIEGRNVRVDSHGKLRCRTCINISATKSQFKMSQLKKISVL